MADITAVVTRKDGSQEGLAVLIKPEYISVRILRPWDVHSITLYQNETCKIIPGSSLDDCQPSDWCFDLHFDAREWQNSTYKPDIHWFYNSDHWCSPKISYTLMEGIYQTT